jgi:PsbN protein
MVTVKLPLRLRAARAESCDGTGRPPQQTRPTVTETSPALSIAITVLLVLLALTGFGVYLAFGPPSKGLTDPFDDHDD